MKSRQTNTMKKYVSFLRGINVGGNNKIKMAELKHLMKENGCTDIQTVLASGNVLYSCSEGKEIELPIWISNGFGLDIKVLTFDFDLIKSVTDARPFSEIQMHDKIRRYVSLLDKPINQYAGVTIPYQTANGGFKILSGTERFVFSVVDLNFTGSLDGMKILEDVFGKNITTRNYNTLEKIVALDSSS